MEESQPPAPCAKSCRQSSGNPPADHRRLRHRGIRSMEGETRENMGGKTAKMQHIGARRRIDFRSFGFFREFWTRGTRRVAEWIAIVYCVGFVPILMGGFPLHQTKMLFGVWVLPILAVLIVLSAIEQRTPPQAEKQEGEDCEPNIQVVEDRWTVSRL